jgi:hypothetical protein
MIYNASFRPKFAEEYNCKEERIIIRREEVKKSTSLLFWNNHIKTVKNPFYPNFDVYWQSRVNRESNVCDRLNFVEDENGFSYDVLGTKVTIEINSLDELNELAKEEGGITLWEDNSIGEIGY